MPATTPPHPKLPLILKYMLQSLHVLAFKNSWQSSTKLILWCSRFLFFFSPPFFEARSSLRTVQAQMRGEEKSSEWRKWHMGERSECEPLALCLMPSLIDSAAKVKRPDCEFPTEMGLLQGECQPISSLLSYLGTAAASICQPFMAATWGKCVPPLPFTRRDWLPLLWQRHLSFFFKNSQRIHLPPSPTTTCPGLYLFYFSAEIHFDT